jgi:alpha/beta superfamily hydrolase
LRFDFSGSGESEGIFNQNDIKRWKGDLETAIKFMVGEHKLSKIALVGLSLGAYISVLCCSGKIKCVALWSPGYIEEVRDMLCPLLVVAGEDDPDMNISRKTFQAAKIPNRFEVIPSSGHLFLEPLHQTQLINSTLEWVKQWLKP